MACDTKGQIKLKSNFYGESSCIIAKRGYGKSHTARVIVEEGRLLGHTFLIIDPQDAYLNLKGFEYINAQDVKSARGLGVLLSQSNKNVVIRTKRLPTEEQAKFVRDLISEYRRYVRKGIQTVVIDEIHKFAPEGQKTEAKETIRGMFQENRSDGLGCIAITQRISRLDKTILSQADHLAIGRVTSFRDKEAVKNYIDNVDDIEKITQLKKGEFYLYGFDQETPQVVMIRKSTSEHSGGSPMNLLTENTTLFNKYKPKLVKKGEHTMTDNISTSNELVDKVVPSYDGFMDMAMLGGKVALGGALGGMAGSLISAYVPSPIPMVSSRSLGAGATTIGLYAAYRMLKQPMLKDVAKYAAAGSAVFTLGSLTFDALAALNVQVPNLVNMFLVTATGATPMQAERSASSAAVDLNTAAAA